MNTITRMALFVLLALAVPAAGVSAATVKGKLSPKAQKYLDMANKYKTAGAKENAVRAYMKVPAAQRKTFKSPTRGMENFIWDYGAYAVCFWAGVAGSDLSDAAITHIGDECNEKWVH
jgi:hypothetical protein